MLCYKLVCSLTDHIHSHRPMVWYVFHTMFDIKPVIEEYFQLIFELAWTLLSQRRYQEAADTFIKMTEINSWLV